MPSQEPTPSQEPIRLDLLPRIPADVAVDPQRGVLRFRIDREFPVVVARGAGFVEKIAVDGGAVKLTGWIVDTAYNVPPIALLAAGSSGRILDVAHKFGARSDVASHLNASVDEFGFQLNFKLSEPGAETVSLWLVLQNMEVSHFLTLNPGELVPGGVPRGTAPGA